MVYSCPPLLNHYLEEISEEISSITPKKLHEFIDRKIELYLIDIREPTELEKGIIPGATPVSRGMLEILIEKIVPDSDALTIIYCGAGVRSAIATFSLHVMGLSNVLNLEGGFEDWVNAGLKVSSLEEETT